MSRVLLGALALMASDAWAQEPPRFSSEVRVVELDVAVTRDNRPVGGLTAADFEVRDAGVLQKVELVERSRARVQALLLLDTSESVGGEKLQQLTHAARAFVEGLAPEDAVTLLSFSYRVRLLGAQGGSPAEASSALARLRAGGTTALLDAVAGATALADPRRGRPVLLVFSDGGARKGAGGAVPSRLRGRRERAGSGTLILGGPPLAAIRGDHRRTTVGSCPSSSCGRPGDMTAGCSLLSKGIPRRTTMGLHSCSGGLRPPCNPPGLQWFRGT